MKVINGIWNPTSNGWVAASIPPGSARDNCGMSPGYTILVRLSIAKAVRVTNIETYIQTPRATLTLAAGLLYDLSGVLIARTASLTTAFQSAGLKSSALVVESGKTLDLPARDVLAGYIIGGPDSPDSLGQNNVTAALIAAHQSTPAFGACYRATAAIETTLGAMTAHTALPFVALS